MTSNGMICHLFLITVSKDFDSGVKSFLKENDLSCLIYSAVSQDCRGLGRAPLVNGTNRYFSIRKRTGKEFIVNNMV